MSARFTASEVEAIDKARSTTDRSVWLRSAALAFLAAGQPQSPRRARAAKAEPPPVKFAPAAPLSQKPQRCTHPGTRIIGGYCNQCDHMIESGGLWRT